jgi:TonB family protein
MIIDKQLLQDPWVQSMLPESDKQVTVLSLSLGMCSLVLGYWFNTMKYKTSSQFISLNTKDVSVAVNMEDLTKKVEEKPPEKKPDPPKPKEKPPEKTQKTQKVSEKAGPSGASGGGGGKPKGKGDPNAKQSRGVLALIQARTTKGGLDAYGGNRKLVADLDKNLNSFLGVKKTGSTALGGRKGTVDGKFGEGFNPAGEGDGWGGGKGNGLGGGIGDAVGNVRGGGGGGLKTGTKAGKIKPPSNSDIDIGDDGGGRSKADIMRVVRARTPGLRYIFTKYLKTQEGFGGKIAFRFVIAPSGSVVSLDIVSSTTGSSDFDQEVRGKVKEWNFGPAPNAGNTTVTLPFTFSE